MDFKVRQNESLQKENEDLRTQLKEVQRRQDFLSEVYESSSR